MFVDLGGHSIRLSPGAMLTLLGPIRVTGTGGRPLVTVEGGVPYWGLYLGRGAELSAEGENAVAVELAGGGLGANGSTLRAAGANSCAVRMVGEPSEDYEYEGKYEFGLTEATLLAEGGRGGLRPRAHPGAADLLPGGERRSPGGSPRHHPGRHLRAPCAGGRGREDPPARPYPPAVPTPAPAPGPPDIEVSFVAPVPTPEPTPAPVREEAAPTVGPDPPATPTPAEPAPTSAPASNPPKPAPSGDAPPALPEGATASLTGRDLEAQKLANPGGVTLAGDGLKVTLPYALTDALGLGAEGVLAARLAAPDPSSFEVRFWADGKEVADFGGGAFTITVPVEEAEGMEHFCTAPDGTKIAVSALANGRAEFRLTATGLYTLTASTPEPMPSLEPTPAAETSAQEEPEGQPVPVLPLLGALAAAGGVLLLRRGRGGP